MNLITIATVCSIALLFFAIFKQVRVNILEWYWRKRLAKLRMERNKINIYTPSATTRGTFSSKPVWHSRWFSRQKWGMIRDGLGLDVRRRVNAIDTKIDNLDNKLKLCAAERSSSQS